MEAEPGKVEESLQRTEDRYRLLAENVSDVIFTLDLNLRHTYCSPSVERLRGYTVEEVMAQTLEQAGVDPCLSPGGKANTRGGAGQGESKARGFLRTADTGTVAMVPTGPQEVTRGGSGQEHH
ncbi:MAG: PAS domain-containing protein [Syntrophorhabdales bacterium]|jgi:PAS domain S-box-containing protein